MPPPRRQDALVARPAAARSSGPGDVFLLREGKSDFVGGLISFLLAHLAYLVAS